MDTKENRKQYQAEYRAKNAAKIKEQRRQYYSENKESHYKSHREWLRKNPERRRDHVLDSHLRRTYGITLLDYKSMLIKQHGACAICEEKPTKRRLFVDHCHRTGKVRGLLCMRCNSAIALMRESMDVWRNICNYLWTPHYRRENFLKDAIIGEPILAIKGINVSKGL